jgi:hypothetical protein
MNFLPEGRNRYRYIFLRVHESDRRGYSGVGCRFNSFTFHFED